MNRNIHINKLLVGCVVMIWLLFAAASFHFDGYKPYNPQYGVSFNETRKSLGLSEFDSTWTLYLHEWDCDDCDNPNHINYYKNSFLGSYEGFDTILADPKTFICGRAYEEIWINPNASSTSPCRYSKNIIYDKDTTIFIERDVYWSGNTYRTIDTDVQESLTAEYYFRENRWYYKWRKHNGWIDPSWPKSGLCIPIEDYKGDVGPDTMYGSYDDFVITKREADSLLELWGVIK